MESPLTTSRQKPGSKSYYQDRCTALTEQVAALKAELLNRDQTPPLNVQGPTRAGMLAEQLARYRIARAGLQFFIPEAQSNACDLLVRGLSGKFYTCEVKAVARTGSYGVRLSTTRYIDGVDQNYKYTVEDGIDFFILVDLTSEVLCVLPFSETGERNTMVLEPGCFAWSYKDRFDLFV